MLAAVAAAGVELVAVEPGKLSAERVASSVVAVAAAGTAAGS